MNDNIRLLSAGEFLFEEGEEADCAYIIESGELEISTQSHTAKVVICTLSSGDIVGEMGALDNAPRTASAVAIRDTRLMIVTKRQFTDRISTADSILKLLIKVLLDRYRSGLDSVMGRTPKPRDAVTEKVVREYLHHGVDKIRLESELKEALDGEDLQVFYQPLLDIPNRHIAGFEALTRWVHPTRGLISPRLFIALAEETNLIVPVGLYIFERACIDIAAFEEIARQQNFASPLFMSINISLRQIADPDFLAEATKITTRHGVSPNQIRLEINERLAADIDSMEAWIDQAHDRGFKISLDDFGTGFASLETLYKLNLDTAKIDQAFVKQIDHDHPRNRRLLRDIISLVKGLGLEVVVEGIEEQAQLEFVSALDCEYAQGFLISQSVPADIAKKMLVTPPDLGLD